MPDSNLTDSPPIEALDGTLSIAPVVSNSASRSRGPRGVRACLVMLALLVAPVTLAGAVSTPGGPDSSGRNRQVERSLHTQGVVRDVNMYSPSLKRAVRVLVWLPAGYAPTRSYPVIYALHGTPGNPEQMMKLVVGSGRLDDGITRRAIAPVIVVAPTGGPHDDSDTEWNDSSVDTQQAWGTFVASDLVRWTDQQYGTQPEAEHRALVGVSMGGYGSMNLGLQHGGVFGVVASWSGYSLGNTPTVEGPHGSPSWHQASPMKYLPQMAADVRARHLRISLYVGDRDDFREENERFARQLTKLRIAHRFRVVAGGHAARTWSREAPSEIAWLGRQL